MLTGSYPITKAANFFTETYYHHMSMKFYFPHLKCIHLNDFNVGAFVFERRGIVVVPEKSDFSAARTQLCRSCGSCACENGCCCSFVVLMIMQYKCCKCKACQSPIEE